MANGKILKKPRSSLKKFIVEKPIKRAGKVAVKLECWSPRDEILFNPKVMSDGLSAALADGDQEAFLEILHGWIAALNSRYSMQKLEEMTGISRRALYNLTKDDANPTAETIMSLARAVKAVA